MGSTLILLCKWDYLESNPPASSVDGLVIIGCGDAASKRLDPLFEKLGVGWVSQRLSGRSQEWKPHTRGGPIQVSV